MNDTDPTFVGDRILGRQGRTNGVPIFPSMFSPYVFIAPRFYYLRDYVVGNRCAFTGIADREHFGLSKRSALLLLSVQQYCDERGDRHYHKALFVRAAIATVRFIGH